jgi:NAD(P) transhydrogenase subunit alpha
MPLRIAVIKERENGEKRVALAPETAKKFKTLGADLVIEQSAGAESHFIDTDYEGVSFVDGPKTAYQNAQLILSITPPTLADIEAMPEGAILMGLMRPYESRERIDAFNRKRLTVFAMELLPRISRAQSMDVLSSQGACSGYQCGLIAAARCTKFFPMLTTAAGTIRPARVLVNAWEPW